MFNKNYSPGKQLEYNKIALKSLNPISSRSITSISRSINSKVLLTNKYEKSKKHFDQTDEQNQQPLQQIKNTMKTLIQQIKLKKLQKKNNHNINLKKLKPLSTINPILIQTRNPQIPIYRKYKQYMRNKLWEVPKQEKQLNTTKKMFKIKRYRIKTQHDNYIQRQPVDQVSQIKSIKYHANSRKRYKNIFDMSDNKQSFKKYKPYVFQYEKQRNSFYKYGYRRRQVYKKSFKKVVHAVLFTIYLKNFAFRLKMKTYNYFQKQIKPNINKRLIVLKTFLFDSSRQIFNLLAHQNIDNYDRQSHDDSNIFRQKIKILKKLVNLQIKNLQKNIKYSDNRDKIVQVLYFLCKNGNYSCLQPIHTPQQLNIMSISQKQGYVSADKYLQQSIIVSLVFIKILLFNIFFHPQTSTIISNSYHRQIFKNNLNLIGNILYQLFIDVQDSYLDKANPVYTVGNWKKANQIFKIQHAESMIYSQNGYQKNELISGLLGHKYIIQTYQIKTMLQQKSIIKDIVRLIHQSLVQYHLKFRKNIF